MPFAVRFEQEDQKDVVLGENAAKPMFSCLFSLLKLVQTPNLNAENVVVRFKKSPIRIDQVSKTEAE